MFWKTFRKHTQRRPLTVEILESRVTPATLCVDSDNATGITDGSALRPFTSVQSAVDAAASNDIIAVAAGTYVENVTIPDNSLSLLGGFVGGTSAGYAAGQAGDFGARDPAANVTRLAAASAAAPVVFVNNVAAKTILIDGFTVSGGLHGIYVVADFQLYANVTVAHNIIENNGPAQLQAGGGQFAFVGGGVYAVNATITIASNVIRNNHANRGGGIYVGSATDYIITDNLIDSNSGWDDHGGGVVIVPMPATAPGNGTFARNTVRNNVASRAFTYGWGGGLLISGFLDLSSKIVTLSHNTWIGNSAPSVGGAIFADNGSRVILDHELIHHNSTDTGFGRAIYVNGDGGGIGSFMTINNSTIADNANVALNPGQAIYVEEYSHVIVKNSILWGNIQDFVIVPDGTGSTISVSYSDSQQPWPGTGNLSVEPLFANPALGDYHEKSQAGRWDPAANGGAGAFVVDAVTSTTIDAGDPASDYLLETAPHGARVNMGVHGNTAQASRSVHRNRALVGAFDSGTFTLQSGDMFFSFGAANDVPLTGDWNGDGEVDVGVWRPSTARFYLDSNGNDRFDAGSDAQFSFGSSTDLPISGDWNGDGRADVGVWRPSQARFFLDSNANRQLDAGDVQFPFGISSDLPLTGDWNGDDRTDVGVWRSSGAMFYLDSNGNRLLESGVDAQFSFGAGSDVPVTGDWNGDGAFEVGIWRPSSARFYLDSNGNRRYDAGADQSFVFGGAGDRPLTGDWNGDGVTEVGRANAAQFALDADADQRLGSNASFVFRTFQAGDVPLTGDWNGDGRDEVGIWRSGVFYLDLDGDRVYTVGVDSAYSFGAVNDVPVTGDWNGDGITDIGVWRPSAARFFLDSNGNHVYNAGTDAQFTFGGVTTDLPVTGDWNGDGVTDIGVWRPGATRFYLDSNGNRAYNAGVDAQFVYGITTDVPVSGDWNGDGVSDVGVWRPSTATFYLDSNGNKTLDASDLRPLFGSASSKPLAGRWYRLP